MVLWWSLFLAVLTECKKNTSSCGILFLWIVIQHLLSSGCFWSWANTGCNPDFDFLNLGATYRSNPLYCLQIPDSKSAQSLYVVRESTKALLFFWDFFWLFFSAGRHQRQHELWLSQRTGICLMSVCRGELSLVRKEE